MITLRCEKIERVNDEEVHATFLCGEAKVESRLPGFVGLIVGQEYRLQLNGLIAYPENNSAARYTEDRLLTFSVEGCLWDEERRGE